LPALSSIPSWRRLFHAPGAPALHGALRVAIAATSGFVIGRYGLDEPQTAVYATLTPVALLGLGEVGGPRAERMSAYAAATLAGAAVTTLGTLSSDDTLAASLTLFAGGLVASGTGIAGGNAVLGPPMGGLWTACGDGGGRSEARGPARKRRERRSQAAPEVHGVFRSKETRRGSDDTITLAD
jgi:hypothetical protein